tara:strand:- start:188 stop:454 length:267 start_codon:yes stop_codon:yes gene_type:complete
MKVKIMQRSVYHKYAEIEVEVPKDIKDDDVQEYLIDNEEKWVDVIDTKINISEFVYGNGVDEYTGMNEPESDSEWRFDIVGKQYGGHL